VRATIVIVMFTGYTTGAAIGGFVAAWLIPRTAGKACLRRRIARCCCRSADLRAAESIRFLAVTGANRAELVRLAGLLAPIQRSRRKRRS